jgi:hypothetical protein
MMSYNYIHDAIILDVAHDSLKMVEVADMQNMQD